MAFVDLHGTHWAISGTEFPPAYKEVACRVGFRDMSLVKRFKLYFPKGTFILDPYGGEHHSWFDYVSYMFADGSWQLGIVPWYWRDLVISNGTANMGVSAIRSFE